MKILTALAGVILAAGSASSTMAKPPIVLVHGAWETSQIWGFVEKKLRSDGYAVTVVNLPGRPGAEAPMDKISLALYQQTIADTLAKIHRPVVLVGHSFAGFVISAEAEAEPAKIKTLVYVATFLPKNGDSLLSLATQDKGSKVGPALVIDKEKGIASIAYSARANLFGNGAPPAVGDMIAKSIVDEPLAPLATPISLTARFSGVDKVYVHTLHDLVISPDFQALMVKSTPVRLEMSIDTGHTPFITEPTVLAKYIEKSAR